MLTHAFVHIVCADVFTCNDNSDISTKITVTTNCYRFRQYDTTLPLGPSAPHFILWGNGQLFTLGMNKKK